MTVRKKLTVIGGGPGGYVAAVRAAQLGAEVSLVEAGEVGGACLNHGCIPSKTLIHNVEVMELVRRSEDYGVMIQGRPEFDIDRVNERSRKVIEIQVRGIHALLKSHGVRLVQGRGSLNRDRTVEVITGEGARQSVSSDAVILAMGSVPIRPSLFPFETGRVLTSEEALRPRMIPGRILIVGGGVEGSEFSFVYRGLGSEVSLVEFQDRILPGEDEDLSGLIAREMRKKGIEIHTGVKVEEVRKESNLLTARLSDGREIVTDQVLVSIGRTPLSAQTGLEEAGVALGPRGEVMVNPFMETSVPGIFALGDLVGKMMLAHVASKEGKVAAWNAMCGEGGKRSMSYEVVPAGIFTIPEAGTVGIREREASARGLHTRVGRFLYRGLGRAHTTGEVTGQVKVIASAEDGRILGVQAFGPHASDLVHEAAVAIRFGAKASELADLIHAHPTFSEVLMEAAEDVGGDAIHALKR